MKILNFGGGSEESIWDRYGVDTISRSHFLLLMGFFILASLGLTAFTAQFSIGWLELIRHEGSKPSYHWVGPIAIWQLILGVLVCSFGGTWLARKYDNPFISLFGYALLAGSFGLLLGPTIGMYEPESVMKIIFITAIVTGVLTFIGAAIPKSLESWSGWILGALTVLLIGLFVIPVLARLIPGFPVHSAMRVWDWVGVAIFSGCTVYDMNRAMRVPATVGNAVDCSLALYLDVINLLIRFLQIFGVVRK